MKSRPKVAVVVVSHNTRGLLLECINSVIESTQPDDVEIVVVDNASEDGSYEAVLRDHPQAVAIRNAVNVGFAAACNQGIGATSAPLILLLNSDAKLTSQAFRALCDCMRLDRCGAAGCKVVNADGVEMVSVRNFLTPFNQALELTGITNRLGLRQLSRTYRPALSQKSPDCSVDWVEGSCLILSRAALDEVGLFDERFFMYSEDEDLCLRLRSAGWSVCYSASGSAIHVGGASTSQNRLEMLRHFYSSQLYFLSKHRGLTPVLLYLASMSFVLMVKRFLLPTLSRNREAQEAGERLFALRRAWSSRNDRR
ncbi:MAG: glycosyltransferase family 2 protein [Acidobacteriota bacterium]